MLQGGNIYSIQKVQANLFYQAHLSMGLFLESSWHQVLLHETLYRYAYSRHKIDASAFAYIHHFFMAQHSRSYRSETNYEFRANFHVQTESFPFLKIIWCNTDMEILCIFDLPSPWRLWIVDNYTATQSSWSLPPVLLGALLLSSTLLPVIAGVELALFPMSIACCCCCSWSCCS